MQPSDLSPSEISALTRILQLLNTESPAAHSSRIAIAIPDLPSHLKRAGRLCNLIRTASTRSTSSNRSSTSTITNNSSLCKQHKPLSTPLIHNIFTLLALEVGRRLNTLTVHAATLTPQERDRITSLRELHSLWLPPQVYQKTFLSPPPTEQWAYNPTQCPGCTLSLIAGHMPTLLSLRVVLLSRTSSQKRHVHRNPRLTVFIEAWISHMSTYLGISEEDFETLISANDADAFALKSKRKEIWAKKREARRVFRASQDEQKARRSRRGPQQVAYWDTASKSLVTVLSGEPQPGPPLQPQSQPEKGQEQQPTFRVSAATTHPPTSIEDGSESNPSDAENNLIDMYAALTSTPYLASIASSMSLLEPPPRSRIYPQQLTTHDNVDIGEKGPRKKVLPVRPLPTNFNALVSGAKDSSPVKTRADLAEEQRQRQQPPTLNTQSLTSVYSSLSGNQHDSRNTDSYSPPVFPHHAAYNFPTAANHAKRYQNLLSPHPLQQESDEGMPNTPNPQVDADRRTSVLESWEDLPASPSPEMDEHQRCSYEEDTSNSETPPLPRRSSKRPLFAANGKQREEAEQYRPNRSHLSASSLGRSQTTRDHPSSRVSSMTSISEDRVNSTFTIKEAEVEPDWYAGKSDADLGRARTTRNISDTDSRASTRAIYGGRDSQVTDRTTWSDVCRGVEGVSTNSRSSTTPDVSNTNPRSSITRDVSSTNARSSTRRKYGGINSVDSDAARWSDLYRGFPDDAKQ